MLIAGLSSGVATWQIAQTMSTLPPGLRGTELCEYSNAAAEEMAHFHGNDCRDSRESM